MDNHFAGIEMEWCKLKNRTWHGRRVAFVSHRGWQSSIRNRICSGWLGDMFSWLSRDREEDDEEDLLLISG